MVPGFSSVHLPSLQPRDHPPRLRGEVVEPAPLFATRVVRYRLVEREGVASRLEAVAPIGAPERRRPAVDVPHACDAEPFGAPELGAPEVGALLDRDLDGNTPGLCLDAEQDGAGKAVLDLDLHRSLLH